MIAKYLRFSTFTLTTCAMVFIGGCKSTDVYQTLEEYGLPVPEQDEGPSTGKKILAGVTGCAAGGALGYYGIKYFEDKMQEEGYTNKEIDYTAKLIGGLGCIVGGKVAVNIVKNMDAAAKKAQEEAWQRAQQQARAQVTTEPQVWASGTYSGTVEIVEPTTDKNGRECAARRNFITTDEGNAEQFIPVCKNSSGIYEPVEV